MSSLAPQYPHTNHAIMDDSFKEPPLPTFKSIDDECAHWKGRYNAVKQKLIETKQELSEFEESSRQLEAELEASLDQREKNIQDLKHSLNQLQTDNESLRVSMQRIPNNRFHFIIIYSCFHHKKKKKKKKIKHRYCCYKIY